MTVWLSHIKRRSSTAAQSHIKLGLMTQPYLFLTLLCVTLRVIPTSFVRANFEAGLMHEFMLKFVAPLVVDHDSSAANSTGMPGSGGTCSSSTICCCCNG